MTFFHSSSIHRGVSTVLVFTLSLSALGASSFSMSRGHQPLHPENGHVGHDPHVHIRRRLEEADERRRRKDHHKGFPRPAYAPYAPPWKWARLRPPLYRTYAYFTFSRNPPRSCVWRLICPQTPLNKTVALLPDQSRMPLFAFKPTRPLRFPRIVRKQ